MDVFTAVAVQNPLNSTRTAQFDLTDGWKSRLSHCLTHNIQDSSSGTAHNHCPSSCYQEPKNLLHPPVQPSLLLPLPRTMNLLRLPASLLSLVHHQWLLQHHQRWSCCLLKKKTTPLRHSSSFRITTLSVPSEKLLEIKMALQCRNHLSLPI